MIEEQAVVDSAEDGYAYVRTAGSDPCGGCSNKAGCGTGLAASLFGVKPRLLRVRNTHGVKPGDVVTIGLNRTALMIGSLLIYFLPLLMLIVGAIAGESMAVSLSRGAAELLSVVCGLAFAGLAFIFSRRILKSGSMERLFQPVLLPDSAEASLPRLK